MAVAAEALGRMVPEQVPAPLRRLASFAPSRRARLGGDRILETAEADEVFRGRLAVQARAVVPEAGVELDAGDAESIDAAALAWLERPDGWQDVVTRAAESGRAREEEAAVRAADERADRLQRRLDDATDELKAARQKARDDLDSLRVDNADLRRKLGESRRQAKDAVAAADALRRTVEEAGAAARTAQAAAEAEIRRLRARITELEQRLVGAQRERRTDRDDASVRARLLLDSVVDAATGLKRELGLPTVEGAPADLVAADEGDAGHRASSGASSLSVDDPALLDQLLALPRVHMLVDGYNVTKTGWPEAALDVQRDRLIGGLATLGARTGAELTVVFDAAETTTRPMVRHAARRAGAVHPGRRDRRRPDPGVRRRRARGPSGGRGHQRPGRRRRRDPQGRRPRRGVGGAGAAACAVRVAGLAGYHGPVVFGPFPSGVAQGK